MWKVTLAFVTHRLFLLLVALCAINARINSTTGTFSIQPTSLLFHEFSESLSRSPEAQAITRVSDLSWNELLSEKDAFLWLGHALHHYTGLSAALSAIILSNILFILFLSELLGLVERLAIPGVAEQTAVLAVLWITSYESSLGSNYTLAFFIMTFVLRTALTGAWLLSGLGLGLLCLSYPYPVAILPLMLFIFWHFKRHFLPKEILVSALGFVLPTALAITWNWHFFQDYMTAFQNSAYLTFISAAKSSDPWAWALSKTYLGQTIAFLVLLTGSIVCLVTHYSFVFKIVPLASVLILLCSVSYNQLASAMLLAGSALGGIASVSSPIVSRILQITLLTFGGIEVFQIFRG